MEKKVKLPQTRLEVRWGDYGPGFYLRVSGHDPVLVRWYQRRSDAIRGAKRFATKILTTNERRQLTKLDIYCDGELVG